MNTLKNNRSFLSAAVMLTFIPTAITSILLLFHVHSSILMEIHQWLGLVFLTVCCCHIFLNWNVMKKHLTKKEAKTALAITAIITICLGFIGSTENHDDRGRNYPETHFSDRHRQ